MPKHEKDRIMGAFAAHTDRPKRARRLRIRRSRAKGDRFGPTSHRPRRRSGARARHHQERCPGSPRTGRPSGRSADRVATALNTWSMTPPARGGRGEGGGVSQWCPRALRHNLVAEGLARPRCGPRNRALSAGMTITSGGLLPFASKSPSRRCYSSSASRPVGARGGGSATVTPGSSRGRAFHRPDW